MNLPSPESLGITPDHDGWFTDYLAALKGSPQYNEDMTNADRAERALKALVMYNDQEEVETIMADFLCDMRHLADVHELDWQGLLDHGDMHYFAEVQDEREDTDE